MQIASGSDERDLRYMCDKSNPNHYFLSVNGSPEVKSDIVKDILIKKETILIDESINDVEAAQNSNIEFYGFNNKTLRNSERYIYSFMLFVKDSYNEK